MGTSSAIVLITEIITKHLLHLLNLQKHKYNIMINENEQIIDNKISLIQILGFKISENSNTKYKKNYADGSYIFVDFSNETIIYSSNIRMDRRTICNFSKEENFVVLECVNCLLDIGYKGDNLYLEKNMGDEKDYVDIAIYDKNAPSKIYTIIECKVFGESFNKAVSKAQKEGKQVLRYAIQDRHCSYIILYTSQLTDNKVKRIEKSIDLTLYAVDNREELFNIWDKTFAELDFFKKKPYALIEKSIKKKDLIPISVNDIGDISSNKSIYYEFKEILRRHSVSDKDNAYNKIFNLFLCKIVDEDEKLPDEDMDFQWKSGEDADTVLLRLSDLYKKGMKSKLNLTITDYTEKDLEKAIQREIPDELKKIFIELRLYKNNEFAFKEVFDKRTFYENAAIIKEVVRLLERKQIKYSTKQQFLGDFFEKLLNMGIKQETGQFFTPIQIAEFILRSLPIKNIIDEKVKNKDEKFLPYVIDYSCGSGHFLTEAMERVQHYLSTIDDSKLSVGQKNNLYNWNNFAWAKEFIYGIEDDYRLAKTTKVACFLNGDGDGNIIYANGLDCFDSPNYWGRLHCESDENNRFDMVVANPPYSVPDFKERIRNGRKYFSLFDKCGKDDIESLFVERTGQLLKDNGVAGIILPSTFLISQAYADIRKYLLQTFRIKAICLLGKQTFAATDKSTCVLFLKKIPKQEIKEIRTYINTFFIEFKDFQYRNKNNVIDYIKFRYNIDLHEYHQKIESGFLHEGEEKDNLFIWMINYMQCIPIINSGDKEEELLFLGYKHTNKKKYEGIRPYPTGKKKIETFLFSKNENEVGIDKYILNSFDNNKPLKIQDKYKNYIKYAFINDCIDMDNRLYMIITKEFKTIESDLPTIALSNKEISEGDISSGSSAPEKNDTNSDGDGIPFIRAKHLNNIDVNYEIVPQEYITCDKAKKYSLKLFKKGSIVFPKSGQSINTNNIAILGQDSYIVNHLAVITCKNEIIRDYVFYLLKDYHTSNFKLDDTADYPTISLKTIKEFKIPYSYDIAKNVYVEMKAIDRNMSKKSIEEKEKDVLWKYVYK